MLYCILDYTRTYLNYIYDYIMYLLLYTIYYIIVIPVSPVVGASSVRGLFGMIL